MPDYDFCIGRSRNPHTRPVGWSRPAERPFGRSYVTMKPLTGPGSLSRRVGAAALILGPVQFLVVHLIVQLAWPAPYSWTANAISDLGAAGCGPWPGDGRYVCSPLHDWMNGSFAFLGLLFVAGLVLTGLLGRSGVSWSSRVFLVLAGIGFVLAGLAPADVNQETHILAAVIIFFCGNLGLLYVERSGPPLWSSTSQSPKWRRSRQT